MTARVFKLYGKDRAYFNTWVPPTRETRGWDVDAHLFEGRGPNFQANVAFRCEQLSEQYFFISTQSKWAIMEETNRMGISIWEGRFIFVSRQWWWEPARDVSAAFLLMARAHQRAYHSIGALIHQTLVNGRPMVGREVAAIIDQASQLPDDYTIKLVIEIGNKLVDQRAYKEKAISLNAQHPLDEYFAFACLIAFQTLCTGVNVVVGGPEIPERGVMISTRPLPGSRNFVLTPRLTAEPEVLNHVEPVKLPLPHPAETVKNSEKKVGFWDLLLGRAK